MNASVFEPGFNIARAWTSATEPANGPISRFRMAQPAVDSVLTQESALIMIGENRMVAWPVFVIPKRTVRSRPWPPGS